jgi:hypothetical protein
VNRYIYEKLLDAKKQLNNTLMQVQTANSFSRRQNKALITLIKLQSHGVSDDEEILNICGVLKDVRLENAIRLMHNSSEFAVQI